MNAYELADKLETDAWDKATIVQSIHLGINMLRQQANRIAELEKDLALKTRDRDVFRNFTLAYEERIAQLEKDLFKYDKLAWDDLSKQATYDAKKHGAEE